MKVLQFPPGHNLLTDLEEKCNELNELHDTLRRAYDLTHTLEEKLNGLEANYSAVLNRYCNAVGTENVPVRYFEYATEGLHVDVDSGDIIFTPWSEEDET